MFSFVFCFAFFRKKKSKVPTIFFLFPKKTVKTHHSFTWQYAMAHELFYSILLWDALVSLTKGGKKKISTRKTRCELKPRNKAKAQRQEGSLLSWLGPNSRGSVSNMLKRFSPLLCMQVWHFLATMEILTRSANSDRFSGRPLGMKSHPRRQRVGRPCRQKPGDAS